MATTKKESAKDRLGEYVDIIAKIREETSAFAALKSKRFTVAMALILVLGWIAVATLQVSAVLAIPILALAAWVGVAYMKGQAQVDAEQQKALGRIGGATQPETE